MAFTVLFAGKKSKIIKIKQAEEQLFMPVVPKILISLIFKC
jgi:hypothetical protein